MCQDGLRSKRLSKTGLLEKATSPSKENKDVKEERKLPYKYQKKPVQTL